MKNFHLEAPEFLFANLAKGRNVLIDAAPGIGKSRAAAKAAVRLVKERGSKVLLLEPTKTLRAQMVQFVKMDSPGISPYESKAISDYHCPIIGTAADPQLCAVSKNQCKMNGRRCAMLEDINAIKNSPLTVATFAKFLLAKSYFGPYDVIIIDESHGFENAETTFLQTYLLIQKLEEVATTIRKEYPEEAGRLDGLARGLRLLREQVGDSLPLEAREVERIKEVLGDERFRVLAVECSREVKYPAYRNLYTNMSALHFRMGSINDNLFFFYEGALFGRPKNMALEVANFFRDRNIGLLSATIADAMAHAKACGVDLRRFDDGSAKILEEYPAVRRRSRKLVALTDGPSLSKSNEAYEIVRQQANEILHRLLSRFQLKTLVLFRSYTDQRAAWQFLSTTDVAQRIMNIEQGDDPDEIDEKIRTLRAKDVILTTAASRLWEGVDIPGLRLVTIDALPFPGKDPLDREYNFRAGYQAMVKKLKQGLGRVVRSDDDWGAAVVVDRRFVERFTDLSHKLPWHMGDDFERVSVEEALVRLEKFFASRSI